MLSMLSYEVDVTINPLNKIPIYIILYTLLWEQWHIKWLIFITSSFWFLWLYDYITYYILLYYYIYIYHISCIHVSNMYILYDIFLYLLYMFFFEIYIYIYSEDIQLVQPCTSNTEFRCWWLAFNISPFQSWKSTRSWRA